MSPHSPACSSTVCGGSSGRVGRNSFYRLAEKGRATFESAARHIYNAHPPDWTGTFNLVLLGNGADRENYCIRFRP